MRIAHTIVFLAALLIASAAGAQHGIPGLTDKLHPDFNLRHIPVFTEELGLTPQQEPVIRALLEDYRAAFDAGIVQLRDRISTEVSGPSAPDSDTAEQMRALRGELDDLLRQGDELRRAGDQDGYAKLVEKATDVRARMRAVNENATVDPGRLAQSMARLESIGSDWRAERIMLRDGLIGDVLAVLDQPQIARWDGLERRVRRDTVLPQGELSGERLNLYSELDQIDLDAIDDRTLGGLAGIFEAYELALDAAIVSREMLLDQTALTSYRAAMARDIDRQLSILRTRQNARAEVRDVNLAFARQVEAALPEDLAAAWAARIGQQAFGRVYRSSRGKRVLRVVRGLADLTPEEQAAIDALATEYEADLGPINDRIVDAIVRYEPEQAERRLLVQAARRDGTDPPTRADPINEAFSVRRDLDADYVERVRALLGDERLANVAGMDESSQERIERVRAERTDTMRRYDVDGDGRLSAEERARMNDGR